MAISRWMKAEWRPNSKGVNRNNVLQFPAAKKRTIYVKRHIHTNKISSQISKWDGSCKIGIMSIGTIKIQSGCVAVLRVWIQKIVCLRYFSDSNKDLFRLMAWECVVHGWLVTCLTWMISETDAGGWKVRVSLYTGGKLDWCTCWFSR